MTKLHISDSLLLPRDTVTSTLVVYGGKGTGKTNFAMVLAEELSKLGLRWAYLDPMGVVWGLRHSKNGKGPGVECLILGGSHGDIPIEPTGGGVVADLVADENVNVIIDFSRKPSGESWGVGEKIRFVTEYGKRIFQRQSSLVGGRRREPIFQILDEAARYVPQMIRAGQPELAMCVSVWAQIVEEARNAGIGVGLFTQRSARLNKDVAELADAMFAFRTVGPNSVAAVTDWLGEHVSKQVVHKHIETVRSLPVGSCLVVSPGWLQVEKVVQIRERETFDSSATPKPGESAKRVTGTAAKPDLDKYVVRMQETIERQKENDPKELRKQIGELRKQLATQSTKSIKATVAPVPGATRVAMQAAVTDAVSLRDKQWHSAVSDYQSRVSGRLAKDIVAITNGFAGIVLHAPTATAKISPAPARKKIVPVAPARNHPKPVMAQVNGSANAGGDITRPMQRILDACAWMESIGIQQPKQTAVAFLAGYTVGGGAFNNPRGALRTMGMIDYRGDGIVLTDAGREQANTPEQPLTTQALQEHVMQQLPSPEQKILRALIHAYPDSLDNDELARRSGYALGGAFNNPRGRLRTLGLAEYPEKGKVRAADLLFI